MALVLLEFLLQIEIFKLFRVSRSTRLFVGFLLKIAVINYFLLFVGFVLNFLLDDLH